MTDQTQTTEAQPLHERLPLVVIRRFTGEIGTAFSSYESDGHRWFRVWFENAAPNHNIVALHESEFTPVAAPDDLKVRQESWTHGFDLGVEEGLRVAFELVMAQADATNLELQKVIDAVDMKNPDEGYGQRVALRGRSEGLREGWELVSKELRRRRSLRRAPGTGQGGEALTRR